MKDDKIFGKNKITELVQWGQGKVVVYSEDKSIYDQCAADPRCLKASPYYWGRKFLAGDCMFPKEYTESLERQLKKAVENNG